MGATTIGAVLAAIAAVAVGTMLPVSEEARHAVSHLAPGASALLLALAAAHMRPRPKPQPAGRLARTVLAAGLGTFGVGQVVEALGAFGYSGYERVNALAALHDGGAFVSVLGLLTVLAGTALSAFAAVACRRGLDSSGTLILAAGAAVVVVSLYVTAGIVFGF